MNESPLFLPAYLSPEMNEGDRILELSLMADRQIAIYQAIDGNLSPEDLLDLIESQEIPMDDWLSDLEVFGYGC